jgi:PIN domain nuclease of toxin-antitoxin system
VHVPEKLTEHRFQSLPITVEDALHVATMAWHHKDPYDLLILSQSILHNLPILSDDALFASYPVTVIWR